MYETSCSLKHPEIFNLRLSESLLKSCSLTTCGGFYENQDFNSSEVKKLSDSGRGFCLFASEFTKTKLLT